MAVRGLGGRAQGLPRAAQQIQELRLGLLLSPLPRSPRQAHRARGLQLLCPWAGNGPDLQKALIIFLTLLAQSGHCRPALQLKINIKVLYL